MKRLFIRTISAILLMAMLGACGNSVDLNTTDPTNPGTTDPGTTTPGSTDPGTSDPGTTDPGTSTPPATSDVLVNDSGASLQSITVTAPSTRVRVGETLQFMATGNYSDGSSADITINVSWSTSVFSSYASIDSSGLLSGLQKGISSVIAIASNGTTSVTGGSSAYIDPALVSITVSSDELSTTTGNQIQFHAYGEDADGSTIDMTSSVTWSSSNTSAASVNTSTGLATASGNGTSTITATHDETGLVASGDLTVADDFVSLSIDSGASTTHTETVDASTTEGFDPYITAYYDHTTTDSTLANILETTSINLQHGFDSSSSDYLYKLSLQFAGTISNSYTINTDAESIYVANGVTYNSDDATNSSGYINVTTFDEVTGRIAGSYNLVLCKEGADCSQAANQITLSGDFDVKRNTDQLFYLEGSSDTPKDIGTASLSYSGIVSATDPNYDYHSYYSLAVTPNTEYTVRFYNQTDGNVVFEVYDDPAYTNMLCDLATITQDDKVCQTQTTASNFYIKASGYGLYYSDGARFMVDVSPAPIDEGSYATPLDITAALPSSHDAQVSGYSTSYYKFTVTPGETYTVRATNLTERIRMDVTTLGSYNYTEDCSQEFSDTTDLACSVTIPDGITEALLEMYTPGQYGAFFTLSVESGGLTTDGTADIPVDLGAAPVSTRDTLETSASRWNPLEMARTWVVLAGMAG